MALANTFGQTYGPDWITGTKTDTLIDSVYAFNSSGDAAGVRTMLVGGLSSQNLTVYMYCDAVTGTVTDLFQMEIREAPPSGSADDDDRPRVTGGSVIASSATATPAVGWVAFTFTSISLTEGTSYYYIIKGLSGVDGSNNAEFTTRSGASGASGMVTYFCQGFSTTDGFSSDPSMAATVPPVVFVKDDGGASEEIFGTPWVTNGTASETNWRGNRITVPEEVQIFGAYFGRNTTSTNPISFGIYKTDGTEVFLISSIDVLSNEETTAIGFDPITLEKGEAYDVVFKSTSGTGGFTRKATMGSGTIPADVSAAAPNGDWVRVTGATPGSFSVSDDEICMITLLQWDQPVVAGGGSALPRARMGC